MSRSGYTDDYDSWSLIRWRGQVASAIRGKKGQAFLREIVATLEAMPEKRLIANELRENGEVCALGAVGAKRGMNLEALDPEDYEIISVQFGIAEPLVREIEHENDDGTWPPETPEERWTRMYNWAKSLIREEKPNAV